jgi:hypothetical protein
MFVAIVALIVAMSGSAIAIQQAQSGDSLIAQRTLSGNRLRLNTVTGKEVVDLAWHNLVLINGWVNYNTNQRLPAWALDAQGIVHFRGAIYQSAGSISKFAVLPTSIRPTVPVWLTTNLTNAEVGRVDVYPGGGVFAEALVDYSAAQSFTSLDGVTYAVH